MPAIDCPACNKAVLEADINKHLDSDCTKFLAPSGPTPSSSSQDKENNSQPSKHVPGNSFFQTPIAKRQATLQARALATTSTPNGTPAVAGPSMAQLSAKMGVGVKRTFSDRHSPAPTTGPGEPAGPRAIQPVKKSKNNRTAPLAERMRPSTLDDIHGQDLVGPAGVLRALIESDRVPSMILWGPSGTGKTTIARCIARKTGSRFIEMNATSTGVGEVKKMFDMAANEAQLTGKRTIIFCDEIHRFTKAQQDVFLKPVENGNITLIGATTENPSFRIQNALLSRCRTFTLSKLGDQQVVVILQRALEDCISEAEAEAEAEAEENTYQAAEEGEEKKHSKIRSKVTQVLDDGMMTYLATFADGDARTALNLLDLSLSLALSPSGTTQAAVKAALTRTLVYDRVGDQHYDTISAFHKSVRGSDPDATLYYLARMIDSGEDPLFIARRMVVIASEDVGLADNTLLPLATAAYTAAQQIGLPEARIPLAHCAVALALAKKSTRAYRGLNNAMACLKEPGAAGLAIPLHLRNAPTRLMTELGYGKEYKYPPNYVDGRVNQEYLPDSLKGRVFLEERDLGTEMDPDL